MLGTERGFHDCEDCRGEGVVRRYLPSAEIPELTDLDRGGNEQTIVVKTEVVACPGCDNRRVAIKAANGRRPKPEERKDVVSLAWWLNANMVEGSRFYIDDYDWSRLCRPYGGMGRMFSERAEDRLMSNLIGSGWGAWTVKPDYVNGGIHIERHKPGNKRVYADADRRHRYKRVDGELVHWDCINSAEAVAAIARYLYEQGT